MPTTPGAYGAVSDSSTPAAFVAKPNPSGTHLDFLAKVDHFSSESFDARAIDSAGRIVIAC
jgi:hypothetical protein